MHCPKRGGIHHDVGDLSSNDACMYPSSAAVNPASLKLNLAVLLLPDDRVSDAVRWPRVRCASLVASAMVGDGRQGCHL